MKKGAKVEIICPAQLGYGSVAKPGIPPNSPLLLSVQIVEVENNFQAKKKKEREDKANAELNEKKKA